MKSILEFLINKPITNNTNTNKKFKVYTRIEEFAGRNDIAVVVINNKKEFDEILQYLPSDSYKQWLINDYKKLSNSDNTVIFIFFLKYYHPKLRVSGKQYFNETFKYWGNINADDFNEKFWTYHNLPIDKSRR